MVLEYGGGVDGQAVGRCTSGHGRELQDCFSTSLKYALACGNGFFCPVTMLASALWA